MSDRQRGAAGPVAGSMLALALAAASCTGAERNGEPTRDGDHRPGATLAAEVAPRVRLAEPTMPQRAQEYADRLSLREQAGQVIVARYAGTAPPTRLVTDLHLGGVIVMSENIATLDRLRRGNRRLQEAAERAGRRWPLFIGVDQEGGVVERVKGAATRFPSFMTLGAADRPPLTERVAAASGAELADLGFTAVFAPSADVTVGRRDPTIGSRSAGSRPALVAEHATAAVRGYRSAGVLPVAKHYPGHGSVPADSHLVLPVQTKSWRTLAATDLVPFRRLARERAPAVMVGHLDVRAVDPGTPASLSRPVVHGTLRGRLGFRGLVVTDALDMRGVTARNPSGEAAVRALAAGNDVLLMPPRPRVARDAIVRAVRDGRLARNRLEEAVTRQIATLLRERADRPTVRRAVGSGDAVPYRASAAAATVVAGPCRGRLVGESVRVTGPADAVARFRAAARRAGLPTGSGTHVSLVGYGGGPGRAEVVVALDRPHVLGRSHARSKVAMYGDTPGAMRALVEVLLGKARAPGRLPVPVPGVAGAGC